MMGKITCANVLSDLYAMGVVNCDSLIMLMSECTQMSEKERDTVMPLIVTGFRDNAIAGGLEPICQNIVLNPWVIIGGAATAVCQSDEFIVPSKAEIGDAIILTKPIGAQMACNVHRWLTTDKTRWDNIRSVLSEHEAETAFEHAVLSMARLNRTGARLMHKYNAHAGTDVTGFGLLGHAQNLAANQDKHVRFHIHTIPIIAKMSAVADVLGNKKFITGVTPETSGGLLICLPSEHAQVFCDELLREDGWPAWIIGDVLEGEKTATISDTPKLIEVSFDTTHL